MEHIDDLFNQINQLWDHGEFMQTGFIDGKGVSLYKLNGSYHLIWYTRENQILKYEAISKESAIELFSRSNIELRNGDALRNMFQELKNLMSSCVPRII
jgi:hypothetical protein